MTQREAEEQLEINRRHFRNEKGENKKIINGVESIVTIAVMLVDKAKDPTNYHPFVFVNGYTKMRLEEYLALLGA